SAPAGVPAARADRTRRRRTMPGRGEPTSDGSSRRSELLPLKAGPLLSYAGHFGTPRRGSTMIYFECPRCDRPFRADSCQAGDETCCPACDCEFVIPAGDSDDTLVLRGDEQLA